MLLSHLGRRAVIALLLLVGGPAAVAGQPHAYVANLGSDDVSVIDLRTRSVVATLAAGDDPDGIAVSPGGRQVYVAGFLSDSVTVIDTLTNTVSGTLAVGSGPVGVAVSPDGRRLYVANRKADTVSVIDTASGTLVADVLVGKGPNSIAVTPDGAKIYVTNSFSNDPGSVSVIDAGTLGLRADVAVQRSPSRVAITPNGQTLYVTNFRSWNVSVVDVATDRVATTLRISGRPSGVTVNPNGAYAYVTTLGGQLEIIATATDQVVSGFPLGRRAFGVATARHGGVGFVANFDDGTVTALDLADEIVLGDIPVGMRPFAVSVNCVGAGCEERPWTPKPTPTRTAAPTSTRTPMRPTATPTRTPRAALEISAASAAPGTAADLSVQLRTGGLQVIAVAIDLVFAPPLSIAAKANGRPDCAVNPDIDKPSTAFSFLSTDCPPGVSCSAVRAGVISFVGDSTPIAEGSVLFSCRVNVDRGARPGVYTVSSAQAYVVLPPAGEEVARVRNGTIQVSPSRSTIRRASERAIARHHLCAEGISDGEPCSSNTDCPSGSCVATANVCEGGNDDGLLCECASGRCRSEAGGATCGDNSGRCQGGEVEGACCQLELNCAGGNVCVPTQKICLSGTSKGAACLDDRHCPSASCSSVGSACLGGDFEGFPCVDHRDCPRGECFDPNATPTAAPATPARTGSRSDNDGGDGCSIEATEGGYSAWLMAPLIWLWSRRRRWTHPRLGQPGHATAPAPPCRAAGNFRV